MPVNGHAEEASVGGTSHEVPPSWHLIGPLPRPIHWREHLQGFKGVKPYVIPISNRSRTIRSLFVSAPPPGAFSRQGRWGVAESRNESESELCTDAVSPSHLPPRASRGRRGRGGVACSSLLCLFHPLRMSRLLPALVCLWAPQLCDTSVMACMRADRLSAPYVWNERR